MRTLDGVRQRSTLAGRSGAAVGRAAKVSLDISRRHEAGARCMTGDPRHQCKLGGEGTGEHGCILGLRTAAVPRRTGELQGCFRAVRPQVFQNDDGSLINGARPEGRSRCRGAIGVRRSGAETSVGSSNRNTDRIPRSIQKLHERHDGSR